MLYDCFQVAMAGDFILAVASMMIARLRSDDVTLVLSQVSQIINNVLMVRKKNKTACDTAADNTSRKIRKVTL